MPQRDKQLTPRWTLLRSVLANETEWRKVQARLDDSSDHAGEAIDALKDHISAAAVTKLSLANTLADLTSDNAAIVKHLADQPNVKSLRDVALNYDPADLVALVKPDDIPADVVGDTAADKASNYAAILNAN